MKKIIKYSIFSLCLISSVHAIYNIIFYKNSNYEKESLVEGKIVYIDESKKDRVVFDIKEANRYYPSSKMCSKCKNIKEKLLLSERVYRCSVCNSKISRDLNAAINLANYNY